MQRMLALPDSKFRNSGLLKELSKDSGVKDSLNKIPFMKPKKKKERKKSKKRLIPST